MTVHEMTAIHKHIVIPNRSTSNSYHRNPKKKICRTPLEYYLQSYNQKVLFTLAEMVWVWESIDIMFYDAVHITYLDIV